MASSRAQGFHPDPLEEPPSRIVCTGRRRSEPPHIEQAAPARSDLSGGHNPHGADPTTRPSMPPPPIRGQMVRRRRPGCRRRTQPRPLPEAGPAAAPATIAARRSASPRPRRRLASVSQPPESPRRCPASPIQAGSGGGRAPARACPVLNGPRPTSDLTLRPNCSLGRSPRGDAPVQLLPP